jgi:hypothetical protein
VKKVTRFYKYDALSGCHQQKIKLLEKFREEANLPPAGSANDKSTLALLCIGGMQIYGINRSTAGCSLFTINATKEYLRDGFGKSAFPVVLMHAEADTIIQAFNKNITNFYQAILYADRKTCGFCKSSFRRMLPLVGLRILEVWSPNEQGIYSSNYYHPVIN